MESVDQNAQEVEDVVTESVATMYWDDNNNSVDEVDATSRFSVKSIVSTLHSKA